MVNLHSAAKNKLWIIILLVTGFKFPLLAIQRQQLKDLKYDTVLLIAQGITQPFKEEYYYHNQRKTVLCTLSQQIQTIQFRFISMILQFIISRIVHLLV
uniref:Putative secreted protein n=1 Tax=Panstrongylus lignarius TaxID=156445 RepID=A0A224Y346_9HEMI